MPKSTRKRKHIAETEGPKQKVRPFDEKAAAEEEQLSQILFGGPTSFLKCLEEAEREPGTSGAASTDSGVGEDDGNESDSSGDRKPAWFDEDDDGIEVGQALASQRRKLPEGGINSKTNKYSKLLKNKFQAIVGTPKWAQLDKEKADSDSDEEILQTCGFVRKTSKANLPSSLLEFKKVKDLNCETYSEGPYINSIEFHPTSSVALVAGNSGIATLFAVDGRKNNKLHSIAFQRYPILNAKFIQNGNEAILGSRHSHIFSYDLVSAKPVRYNLPHGLTQCKKFVVSPDFKFMAVAGKWGEVHILTTNSKEGVAVLKQDGEVTALTFNPQGNLLFGHSDTGEVTVWDMNMRRVKHKFTDEGCLQGTTIDISSSNQFIATGSAQGVVNLYGLEDVLKNKIPKPRKSIFNLTTGISSLKFNSSSEVLALSSADIQNSVKLFHVGSGCVFSNFPNFESKMGHINALNFSPSSGYIAFGNRKSIVSLYRLKHFKNY
ncbi:unnamed protein product [Brassicogethes aeneus]|uniref:U3 small nucleolar RNA-associated protein 18 homolog n=1 Tax=Brassicogethes aeneus TaxID=1431903 RepID=A0A9P0AQ72_BRAAE|nr:unnamed protein product [Brassicogethes aeneus]